MKRVAFLSFDWDYEVVTEYYLGLQDFLQDRDDIQVVVFSAFGQYYSSHMPRQSTFELFSLCNPEDYDGFLVQGNRTWPPELRQQFVDRAVALNKPVVSINYELKGAHSVGTDNYSEEFDLVHTVLRDRGCKSPAFVNGLKSSVEAQARAQGFHDACAQLGIRDSRFYQANWQVEAGVVTARKILRNAGNLPDVIFCCNDDLAVGVVQTLQAVGVGIPEQIMVTGFDNREIGQGMSPRITTVDRDYRTIAVTALNAVLRLMNGEELPERIFSPAKHILAESCGYAPQTAGSTNEVSEASYKRFYEVTSDFQYALLGSDSLFAILENCERLAPRLGCSNIFMSLNEAYAQSRERDGKSTYGSTCLLVARSGKTVTGPCDGEHVYERYAADKIVPPSVVLDSTIYMVCPLRHNDSCIGTLVTEGVSPYMRFGFVAYALTMLSGAIDAMRKDQLLS